MTKHLLRTLNGLVCAIALCVCSGCEGMGSGGEEEDSAEVDVLSRAWRATGGISNGTPFQVADYEMDVRLGLGSDMRFSFSMALRDHPDLQDTGTWSVNGNVMTLVGGQRTLTLTYVLEGDRLTLTGAIPYFNSVVLYMAP